MLFCGFSFSQVTIGKNASTSNSSVILEFGDDLDKGIILPYTEGEISGAVPGTFIFDANVNRMKLRTNIGWIDLSGQNGSSDLTLQNPLTENAVAQTIIGADSAAADGILVLEATDKAMVLPIVNAYTDIVNPSPGMMVYVKTNKRLAVFNGSTWSFWKP